ncbi:MAG: hypothetical protein GY756_09940 [bacterium]|nr:hypothetical protein [bacterium]
MAYAIVEPVRTTDNITFRRCKTKEATHYIAIESDIRQFEIWRQQREYLLDNANNFNISVGYGSTLGIYAQITVPIRL